ncbi:hypothetical protein [Sorangium sp. So ce854]|uniref:hypothetical protein n=1 Tax=Sorangium sp. So ce854 TaxID=3133322 RepID=UPI003F5F84D3
MFAKIRRSLTLAAAIVWTWTVPPVAAAAAVLALPVYVDIEDENGFPRRVARLCSTTEKIIERSTTWVDGRASAGMRDLVARMMSKQASYRPTMHEVVTILVEMRFHRMV